MDIGFATWNWIKKKVRYINRKIEYEDYDEDNNDFDKDTYDLDNGIRYCRCGRRMEKVIEHIETWGQSVPVENWYCPVCD